MKNSRILKTILFTGFVVMTFSACSKTYKVKVIRAAIAPVETTVTTISAGTVEAEKETPLGFTGAGRVAAVLIRAGDKVQKGQILAHLDNQDLRSLYDEAESEWSRGQELFKEGLISRAARDASKRGYEVARANYDKSMIRAAFDGMVTEVNLEVGELAGPTGSAGSANKPPMRLVDLKPRIVVGEIDEIDLSKVKVGCKARVKVNAATPKPYDAHVSRVVQYISSTKDQDRTSRIELRLDKSEELLPVGASADIEIITQSKPDALAIPARALVGAKNDRSIFVLNNDGIVQKFKVQTGIGNYERYEIVTGVQKGDRVVLPVEDFVVKDGIKATAEEIPWP